MEPLRPEGACSHKVRISTDKVEEWKRFPWFLVRTFSSTEHVQLFEWVSSCKTCTFEKQERSRPSPARHCLVGEHQRLSKELRLWNAMFLYAAGSHKLDGRNELHVSRTYRPEDSNHDAFPMEPVTFSDGSHVQMGIYAKEKTTPPTWFRDIKWRCKFRNHTTLNIGKRFLSHKCLSTSLKLRNSPQTRNFSW